MRENKFEENQEMEESKDLSNNLGNDNFIDNMKLSKTEYIPNSSINGQNSPEENQNKKVSLINTIGQTQNSFKEELAETKMLPVSNIKNDNNNENNNLNENGQNNSLEKNESNKQMKENQKSQFIESHHIYDQQPNIQKSEFIESHHIYESNPDQIDKNAISKPINNIVDSQKDFKSYAMTQNQNQIEVKKEIDQIKQFENDFNSLKISKTKYLSEEELSEAIKSHNKNNENIENKTNENKEESQIKHAYPSDRLGKNDNAFSNANNNNIQATNNETGGGINENNANTNILGNDAFIKMSKTQYVQDDNLESGNINNNEVMQEPFRTKEIYTKPNTVRVLKIEDEEQISICPDFISQFLRKIFG